LVSDTHESADPLALIDRLQKLRCDVHVHLGDVGGARAFMLAVREFKRSLGSVEGLSEQQREEFAKLVGQGISPMRAYGDAMLGADAALREKRRLETQESYDGVIRALGALANAYCLAGNVDKALFKAGVVGRSGPARNVTLVTRPSWVDFGDRAVVLWPSLRLDEPNRKEEFADLVSDFARRGTDKRQVVVLGHEQLFKGPPPRVYKERVILWGLDAVTVPWFEPTPSWRHLISFFRQLPGDTEVAYVFGHVHDAQEVIVAGVPALRDGDGPAMRYRLYGLGHRLSPQDRGRNLRRCVRMYYVPIETVAVLTLGPGSMEWEAPAP
jgi:hypothetical protein